MFSEADLLAREVLARSNDRMPGMITGLLHHREQEKAAGLTAGDLMTHPAVTVRPEDSVEQAAQLLYTLGVKRLPVINAGDLSSASSAGPTYWRSSTARTRRSAGRSPMR